MHRTIVFILLGSVLVLASMSAQQRSAVGNKPEQLLMTGINVKSLEKSTDFYSRVLGMKVARNAKASATTPRHNYLSFTGALDEPFLALYDMPTLVKPAGVGTLMRLTLKVKDVPAVNKRVKAEGVTLTLEMQPHTKDNPSMLEIMVLDPDGNTVQVIQD